MQQMVRDLVQQKLTRRGFLGGTTAAGHTAASARSALAGEGTRAIRMSRRGVLQTVWVAACVLAIAAAGSTPLGQGSEDLSIYLPPGQARAVVAKECSYCHSLRGVLQLRKSAKDWEAIVLDMGARGAGITIDDVDPVVRYLADVFGPHAPPFTDVNTAAKDDLMKIPGVTGAGADKLIAQRTASGPLASHDEVRAALGLDAQSFEKVKIYLYVKPTDK